MPDLEPTSGPERANLRISDADRHRVAEVLREAAGDGRIDLVELDQRLEAAYAAKTYADLVPITFDLPTLPGLDVAATPATTPRPAERHVAIMSGFERKGVWTVPEHLTILAVMGGAKIDMRRATFATREVVVTVNSLMGGAEIVVNPETQVVMEGTGIMGGYAGPSDRVGTRFHANSPIVRVRGVAIMGGVSVTRKE